MRIQELLEGQAQYYIIPQGQDSSVVHTATGEIVYVGTVPECQQWIKRKDPVGAYAFEQAE